MASDKNKALDIVAKATGGKNTGHGYCTLPIPGGYAAKHVEGAGVFAAIEVYTVAAAPRGADGKRAVVARKVETIDGVQCGTAMPTRGTDTGKIVRAALIAADWSSVTAANAKAAFAALRAYLAT